MESAPRARKQALATPTELTAAQRAVAQPPRAAAAPKTKTKTMSKMNHSTQWSSSDVGGLCWVSDPAQAYIEARVTSVEKGIVRAEASDGRTFDVDLQLPLKPPSRKQKEPPRRILQRVPLTTNNGVENMDNLQSLQEASILDNIQHRFRMDLIYTNTGPILIAVKPADLVTPHCRVRVGQPVAVAPASKLGGREPPETSRRDDLAAKRTARRRPQEAVDHGTALCP